MSPFHTTQGLGGRKTWGNPPLNIASICLHSSITVVNCGQASTDRRTKKWSPSSPVFFRSEGFQPVTNGAEEGLHFCNVWERTSSPIVTNSFSLSYSRTCLLCTSISSTPWLPSHPHGEYLWWHLPQPRHPEWAGIFYAESLKVQRAMRHSRNERM